MWCNKLFPKLTIVLKSNCVQRVASKFIMHSMRTNSTMIYLNVVSLLLPFEPCWRFSVNIYINCAYYYVYVIRIIRISVINWKILTTWNKSRKLSSSNIFIYFNRSIWISFLLMLLVYCLLHFWNIFGPRRIQTMNHSNEIDIEITQFWKYFVIKIQKCSIVLIEISTHTQIYHMFTITIYSIPAYKSLLSLSN